MHFIDYFRRSFWGAVMILVIIICLRDCTNSANAYTDLHTDVQPHVVAESNADTRSCSATASTVEVRYELTDTERKIVEQVVMAEAGGEPYLGQLAVAQCLLNACERSDLRPDEVVVEYQYTPARPEPTESVRNAVSDVFDKGEVAVNDAILWFYAPKLVDETPWHETQRHVITIEGHKFFAEV